MQGSDDIIEWHKLDGKVELPVARKPPRVHSEYPFAMMEVGDCIEINRSAQRVRQAVWYYLRKAQKRGTGKFAVRAQSEKKSRIWRTA